MSLSETELIELLGINDSEKQTLHSENWGACFDVLCLKRELYEFVPFPSEAVTFAHTSLCLELGKRHQA